MVESCRLNGPFGRLQKTFQRVFLFLRATGEKCVLPPVTSLYDNFQSIIPNKNKLVSNRYGLTFKGQELVSDNQQLTREYLVMCVYSQRSELQGKIPHIVYSEGLRQLSYEY